MISADPQMEETAKHEYLLVIRNSEQTYSSPQTFGSLSTKGSAPTPSQQPHVPGRVQTDYVPVSGRSQSRCGTSAGSCSSSVAGGTCWACARCPGPGPGCRSSQGSAEGHTFSLTSPGGTSSQRHTHIVLSGAKSSGLQRTGAQQCSDPHLPPADDETPPHKQP